MYLLLGPVAQSVASLIADPGAPSIIMEIYHELFSLLIQERINVSYK